MGSAIPIELSDASHRKRFHLSPLVVCYWQSFVESRRIYTLMASINLRIYLFIIIFYHYLCFDLFISTCVFYFYNTFYFINNC